MTTKILGAPALYIQGRGVIDQIGSITSEYGEKALVVTDNFVVDLLGENIRDSLNGANVIYRIGLLAGECCHKEIDRIDELYKGTGCTIIIAVGGGKVLDTAKGVAIKNPKSKLIIVPTIAASDAPSSRICVVYSEKGVLEEVLKMRENPSVLLVDTQIIAKAPVRFLIAGIGDALATKYEALQCAEGVARNSFGGAPTETALEIAKVCYKNVRKYAVKACRDVEQNLVTPAVERVIEACIYQSGLGFEGGGLAAAHGLTRGLSKITEIKSSMHGEQVGFALLVQLLLERRSKKYMSEMIGFYRQIGLPMSFRSLGLSEPSEKHFFTIAKYSCVEGSPIYNMKCEINTKKVTEALIELQNYPAQ